MKDFNQYADDPFFWFKQATELDKAAMLIWVAIRQDFVRLSHEEVGRTIDIKGAPHANLGGVFWLNAGLALENLFKGVIVRGHPHLVVKGAITRQLKTHKLLRLAKLASVNVDVIDAFFLEIATVCVTWAGRYPCSTKPGESLPLVFSEADVIAYRKMFDRLVARLGDTVSKSVTFRRLV